MRHAANQRGGSSSCGRNAIAGVACAIVALSSNAPAQTISGAGTRDCSAFTFALERDSTDAIDSYLSWAQGFVSGVNAANEQRINVAIDHAGLLHWLDRYCRARPASTIYEALTELTNLQTP